MTVIALHLRQLATVPVLRFWTSRIISTYWREISRGLWSLRLDSSAREEKGRWTGVQTSSARASTWIRTPRLARRLRCCTSTRMKVAEKVKCMSGSSFCPMVFSSRTSLEFQSAEVRALSEESRVVDPHSPGCAALPLSKTISSPNSGSLPSIRRFYWGGGRQAKRINRSEKD